MSFIRKLGLSGLVAALLLLGGIGASILGVDVPIIQPSPFVVLVFTVVMATATYVVVYRVTAAITSTSVTRD